MHMEAPFISCSKESCVVIKIAISENPVAVVRVSRCIIYEKGDSSLPKTENGLLDVVGVLLIKPREVFHHYGYYFILVALITLTVLCSLKTGG